MSNSDGDALFSVIIFPIIGGIAGLLLLGPFGFFLGSAISLIIGLNAGSADEKEKRIAELEQQVEELKDESET